MSAEPFKQFHQKSLDHQMDPAFWALATQLQIGQADRARVLLLQGPVGPFFGRLQSFLTANGQDVWRVTFHAGDRLFGKDDKVLNYRGGAADWENWLSQVLSFGDFDSLILFGSERPPHCVARKVAEQHGIKVIALEEGYIRPGFITVESGGNNAHSPLAGQMVSRPFEPTTSTQPGLSYGNLRQMILYGAIYYTARGIATFGKSRELFHRPTPLMREAFCWVRNLTRRICCGERNFAKVQQLLEHWDGHFYLVPLQVSADSNLTRFANGWNSQRLICESIRAFAASAPKNTRLVFKVHPMERGHNTLTPLILKTAMACGVSDRVDVIETGSLGLLTRHSAGMITINSTSGLSAIFHGVPLMVIGQALYAHPQLAVTTPAFDEFWTTQHVAPADLRTAYIAWIKQQALRPGDFYCDAGIEAAMPSILGKLAETQLSKGHIIPMKVAS